MKLLSFKLFLSLLFFLLFLSRPTFATDQYFFQEEFNQERQSGILDTSKWVVYPNQPTQPTPQGCLVDTVRETGGILLLKQCAGIPQFPYIVTKTSPTPNGNFTATMRFQFTGAGGLPTGVKFVDKAPGNGEGYTEIFGVGFEEDVFNQPFRIEYKDAVVFSKNPDSSFYIFSLKKENDIYKIYLNDQLVFTSPPTSDKIGALYIGNPAILPSPGYNWSWPRIDYIRVVDDGPSEIAPEPFLDLPWDYKSTGKDFKQIVFDPNSWFDHKYPLQNFSSDTLGVVKYNGEFKNDFYKSHSGYDYSAEQGVNKHTLVRASADGKAIFLPESHSGGAGNMIKIDHGNGYQTWYEHLEEATPGSKLVVKEEGVEPVDVKKGDVLGRVGLTGNTTGYHIHLSVFKDINDNDDFSDDKPFGLVDPIGWEGEYTDPWEEYSVTDENEITRHGAKSYKLFTELTPPKIQQIPSTGGIVTDDKFSLNIPGNSFGEILNYKIEYGPFDKASETIKSILPSLFLSATNSVGQIISNFNNPINLIYDYSQTDLSNINEDTISFYFFNPQTRIWEKISSTLNKTNKTISAPTNHFSEFAVMGEIQDSISPTTTAQIIGTKGNGTWYKSDVSVSLIATDNPGGKGVSYIVYSLDGEHWDEYEAPVKIQTEGSHKIYFLSHDKVDNTEEVKTVEFSIDKTPPEAKIEVDQTEWDLKVTPLGNDQVNIQRKTDKRPNIATYILTDPAGNTLQMETFDSDQEKIDLFKVNTLQYNSEPKITMPENILDTNYIFYTPKRRPEIQIINQNFNLRKDVTFVIVADAIKNKTVLNILENKKLRKEEKPGIVLLKLQTNKGKLEYSY